MSDDLKANVMRLVEAGVKEDKIKEYVRSFRSGQKAEQYVESQPDYHKPDDMRNAALMGGGALGGIIAAPGGITTPVGIGLGSSIAGQAYDLVDEYFNNKQPQSLPTRAKVATSDALLNTIAPKATTKALGFLGKGISSIARPIKNWTAQTGAGELLNDFANLRVRPDPGAISGNPIVQGVQKGLGYMPGGSPTMRGHASGVIDDMAVAAKDIATGYGRPMTSEGAGGVVKRGMLNAVNRYETRSNDLYNAIKPYFAKGEKVRVSATKSFFNNERSKYGNAKAIEKELNKGIIKIEKALTTDTADDLIDYKALDAIRQRVGSDLGNPTSAFDDVDRGQLKRLYAALDEDISNAVKLKGTEAIKRHELARRYVRMHFKQNSDVIDRVLKKGTSGKVWKYIETAGKDGGEELNRLRRNLLPEEWDVVAGTTIGKLGRATPGAQNITGEAFSTSTFMTNWSKLQPEAKEVLFGGTRYAKLRPELDRLVRVAASLKDVEKMANTSGTAGGMNFTTLFSALGSTVPGVLYGSPTMAIAGPTSAITGLVVAPRYAAKLITSPQFVRWLARGAHIAKTGGQSLKAHIGRLAAIAEIDPELKEPIMAYQSAVRQQGYKDQGTNIKIKKDDRE